MANGKWQMFGGRILVLISIFVFTFTIYHSTFTIARAETCTPNLPKVVAHTGDITGGLDSLVTKDGQGVVIKNGSLIIDLGCFADHSSSDLRLYVIGRSHGAEVSVGQKLGQWLAIPATIPPHYKPYVCTRSECAGYKPSTVSEFCDGKETLPEATDGCVTGDQWFNLDIGSTSFDFAQDKSLTTSGNHQYRYVYISSDKGVHIDAIETIAPSQSVDLYILNGSTSLTTSGNNHLQFLDGTVAGVYKLGATLVGIPAGKYAYTFSCNLNHAVPTKGDIVVQSGQESKEVGPLTCSYGQDGSYQASLTIDSPSGAVSDSASIVIGKPSGANAQAGGVKAGPASKKVLVLLGLLIALAVIFELVHRARRPAPPNVT
ncbi:MAG TPA: hypothetical protein VI953_01670 [Candidatus Paceibacterota bacterium]